MPRRQEGLLPQELIERKIYLIRGEKVMLDRDLAELYGVPVKRLNEQVTRNRDRFPADFMIQLNFKEFSDLKSQFATSSWGGIRKMPFAFTENGVAMLSSVLNTPRAIRVNIQIMRTFTKIRRLLASHQEILKRLDDITLHLAEHDAQFVKVFDAINFIMGLPVTLKPKRGRIGFVPPEKSSGS